MLGFGHDIFWLDPSRDVFTLGDFLNKLWPSSTGVFRSPPSPYTMHASLVFDAQRGSAFPLHVEFVSNFANSLSATEDYSEKALGINTPAEIESQRSRQ